MRWTFYLVMNFLLFAECVEKRGQRCVTYNTTTGAQAYLYCENCCCSPKDSRPRCCGATWCAGLSVVGGGIGIVLLIILAMMGICMCLDARKKRRTKNKTVKDDVITDAGTS